MIMLPIKINWSGGKDSTASCILHLLRHDFCEIVCYIPLLSYGIPLILRPHYDFLLRAAFRFRSMGANVHFVHGITYYNHVHTVISRGRNKGKYRGIGLGFGFCLFRNYSKIYALEHFDCGECAYTDIGIAVDEYKRQSQLTLDKRSILCELGYTEADALRLCHDYGLLSPHYFTASRDGCAICPNAKPQVLLQYLEDYPDARAVLLDIETFCKEHRPEFAPYRNGEWFSDRINNNFLQYSFTRRDCYE